MKRNLHLLISPGFLLGLSLLLANDFLFKPLFHNWLTGKLSDFAGLFIFPLFLAIFAPRYIRLIYLLSAITFAFWKSLYSQPLVDLWNALPLFKVQRAIDSTDLIALAILPLSYLYFQRHLLRFPVSTARSSLKRLAAYAVIVLSLFAFTATQRAGDHMISEDREYEFQVSKTELIMQLEKIVGNVRHYRFDDDVVERENKIRKAPMTEEDRNIYSFNTTSKFCDDTIHVTTTLHARGNGTTLKIEYMIYNCAVEDKQHELDAIASFEKDVVDKLRQNITETSTQ